MVAEPTRRTFLRQAGAGLLAVPLLGGALAGCGGNGDDGIASPDGVGTVATDLPDSAGGDADLLNRALATEYAAIAAYNAGAPLLEGRSLAAAERFLQQERRHAARLRRLIEALGATPEDPRPSYDFGRPDRADDVLRLLQDAERDSIGVYVEIVPEGVLLSKKAVPVPPNMAVEQVNLPCVSRVAPGASVEEEVEIPLPLAPGTPYQRYPDKKLAAEPTLLDAWFELGFLAVPPEGDRLAVAAATADGPAFRFNGITIRSQVLVRAPLSLKLPVRLPL